MTERPPKPEVAPPVWDNIPPELAARPQWLLWRFEWPEPEPGRAPPKKWAKVPYYCRGGRRAGGQGGDADRQALVTLEVVRRRFENDGPQRPVDTGPNGEERWRGWAGIGFGFLPGDGLVGIDIDGAIDDAGEVSQRCLGIVGACGSFTEYSPSGRGCHVIGYAEGVGVNKDNGIGVEMFAGKQYFTVTGRLWPGAPAQVGQIQPLVIEGLNAMITRAKEERRAAAASRPQSEAAPASAAPGTARGAARETPEQLQARVQAALDFMSPDMNYDDWISIGWALRDAFGESGFDLWNTWSSRGGTYAGEQDLRSHWKSFKPSSKPADACVGVIFARARDAGWKPPSRPRADGAARPPRRDRQAPGATSGAPAGGGSGQPPEPPDTDEVPQFDDGADSPQLSLIKGKGKKPEDCRENVLYCLRQDERLRGLVALNAFTELQDKTRSPPWGGEPGEWSEEDDMMLGEFLAREHRLIIKGLGTLRAGVQMAARENRHHPIVEHVKALEWDGTSRLGTWMVDCLGVEDRPYVRLISRFFIMGMVARLLRPGCKFDYMLILQGAQGLGKSSAFKALAEPYFMDTPFRIGDKDSYLSLQGVWLVEFSELESMSKAESTAIKAFVSSTEDRFRPPYGSRMVKMPRRAVLAGTTNGNEFLKDATGDRRMWPVHVTEVRLDLLKACRDQLFAEAYHVLRTKRGTDEARYYPTPAEERELFHPEQDRWRLVDVWTDILADYVNSKATHKNLDPNDPPQIRRGFFSTQELFENALGIKPERMDNAKLMQTRVGSAMRELGFTAERERSGGRKRGYLRGGWEFAPKTGEVRLNAGGGSDAATPHNTAEVADDGDLPI